MEKTEQDSLIEKAQKAFLGYSDFFLAKAQVGETQALETIQTKLASAKWIDGEFAQKSADKSIFSLSTCYMPVYRVAGDAAYKWEEATKGDQTSGAPVQEPISLHAEKHIEKVYSRIPDQLDANNVLETEPLTEEGREQLYPSLYAESEIPFKTNEKHLKQLAADFSPDSRAQITLDNSRLDVIFVPALVAETVWKERKYTCYVNLHNGSCLAEYPFSDKLSDKMLKTGRQLYTARLCSLFSLLFILSYALLALKDYLDKETNKTFNLGVTGVLFALAIVPIFSYIYSLSFKRKLSRNFESCATTHGKLPKAFTSILLAILSWVAVVVAFILFAAN
jgi:hypothetical protein